MFRHLVLCLAAFVTLPLIAWMLKVCDAATGSHSANSPPKPSPSSSSLSVSVMRPGSSAPACCSRPCAAGAEPTASRAAHRAARLSPLRAALPGPPSAPADESATLGLQVAVSWWAVSSRCLPSQHHRCQDFPGSALLAVCAVHATPAVRLVQTFISMSYGVMATYTLCHRTVLR